ncbi:hypothetical protein BGZ79_003004 [Entomortierella chlamydospora]|nr:hypothetical protein BGZ79_003004 [Entomortierella chlamydospora]
MLDFSEYALQDLHRHQDFRSTFLCHLNHVSDCRKQNDAEALRLQNTDEFIATCKEKYDHAITSKVPEAVRAGAAELLTGEIDHQVEVAKDDLGHNRLREGTAFPLSTTPPGSPGSSPHSAPIATTSQGYLSIEDLSPISSATDKKRKPDDPKDKRKREQKTIFQRLLAVRCNGDMASFKKNGL